MAKPVGIATSSRIAVQINDSPVGPGTLTVDNNSEVIWSSGARPDPRWQATDSNGHFHARAKDETYPTLKTRSEHAPCDGSCGGVCQGEGYTVTHYDCAICGEEVEPGSIPGPYSVVVPGLASWSVTVTSTEPVGGMSEQVSVRFEDGDTLRFGVAMVASISSDMGEWKTELVGVGPLGEQG
jgi:hypothetical protein